jgi:hypothetical protein
MYVKKKKQPRDCRDSSNSGTPTGELLCKICPQVNLLFCLTIAKRRKTIRALYFVHQSMSRSGEFVSVSNSLKLQLTHHTRRLDQFHRRGIFRVALGVYTRWSCRIHCWCVVSSTYVNVLLESIGAMFGDDRGRWKNEDVSGNRSRYVSVSYRLL